MNQEHHRTWGHGLQNGPSYLENPRGESKMVKCFQAFSLILVVEPPGSFTLRRTPPHQHRRKRTARRNAPGTLVPSSRPSPHRRRCDLGAFAAPWRLQTSPRHRPSSDRGPLGRVPSACEVFGCVPKGSSPFWLCSFIWTCLRERRHRCFVRVVAFLFCE